jgi:hypothetical protein
MKIYLSGALLLLLCWPVAARPRGESFETIDQNRDGRITLLEMQTISRERFKKADTNNDGQITAEEVLNVMPFFVRGQAREPVVRYLKAQDHNRDGQVSLAEIFKHAEQRFLRLDSNRDGAISTEEFARQQGKWNAEM